MVAELAVKPSLFSKLAMVAVWNAWLGNATAVLTGMTTRRPSVLKKKNNLSFLIGPPMEAAHWLALLKFFGSPALFRNQSFALKELPFHEKTALPGKSLLPDFVT